MLLQTRPLNMPGANHHPQFTLTSGHRPDLNRDTLRLALASGPLVAKCLEFGMAESIFRRPFEKLKGSPLPHRASQLVRLGMRWIERSPAHLDNETWRINGEKIL